MTVAREAVRKARVMFRKPNMFDVDYYENADYFLLERFVFIT